MRERGWPRFPRNWCPACSPRADARDRDFSVVAHHRPRLIRLPVALGRLCGGGTTGGPAPSCSRMSATPTMGGLHATQRVDGDLEAIGELALPAARRGAIGQEKIGQSEVACRRLRAAWAVLFRLRYPGLRWAGACRREANRTCGLGHRRRHDAQHGGHALQWLVGCPLISIVSSGHHPLTTSQRR